MPRAKQRKILALVDAGHTYRQVCAELGVNETEIGRCVNRRRAFRDGLVDTEFCCEPLNLSPVAFVPQPEELERRVAVVRRHREADGQGGYRRDAESGIRIIQTTQDGICYKNFR
jgi:hypothetical protein